MTVQETKQDKIIGRRKFILRSLLGAGAGAICPAVIGGLLAGCGSSDGTATDTEGTDNTGSTTQTVVSDGAITVSGSTITIDLTKSSVSALTEEDGILSLSADEIGNLTRKGLFVIRSSDSEVLALDRTCTHTGCKVGTFEDGVATCPCHGSEFDSEGNVVQGPAASPLASFTGSVAENLVSIIIA